MKKFFVLGLITLSFSTWGKTQHQNKTEIHYTRDMLEKDAKNAVAEYEKLTTQEKAKIVPKAIYEKRYHDSKDKEFLLISVGEGKSLDYNMAKNKALANCRNSLIGQFINEKIKELSPNKYSVSSNYNLVDSGSIINETYGLFGEKSSKEKNSSGQVLDVTRVTCCTPLKYYISPGAPLAVITIEN
jgi:predicted  nucleic acid-binding Zn ribbon protein